MVHSALSSFPRALGDRRKLENMPEHCQLYISSRHHLLFGKLCVHLTAVISQSHMFCLHWNLFQYLFATLTLQITLFIIFLCVMNYVTGSMHTSSQKYYVELNAKLYFSLCSIFRRCFHIKPFLARQFNKTIEYSHAHSSFAPQRTHPSASINICLAIFCIKAPMIIIINFGLLFMLPWHGDCGVIR